MSLEADRAIIAKSITDAKAMTGGVPAVVTWVETYLTDIYRVAREGLKAREHLELIYQATQDNNLSDLGCRTAVSMISGPPITEEEKEAFLSTAKLLGLL